MVNNLNDFVQTHWRYFLVLEGEYLEIEKIIPVDDINENVFSLKYMKLLFSVCSEIDILCKEFIEYFSGNSISKNEENMKHYSVKIKQKFPNFSNEIVEYSNNDIKKQVKPFEDWNLPNTIIQWWNDYNDIKHKRTISDNNIHNYKKANQKNILKSLSGLYQIEMYFFKEIIDKESPNEKLRMPVPQSKRLRIKDWNDNVELIDNRYILYIDDDGYLILSGAIN
jgi:hypothetical protein